LSTACHTLTCLIRRGAQNIELGNKYLAEHNIRHLMVTLGLRTMRQRPAEVHCGGGGSGRAHADDLSVVQNVQGVRGYLGEMLADEQ